MIVPAPLVTPWIEKLLVLQSKDKTNGAVFARSDHQFSKALPIVVISSFKIVSKPERTGLGVYTSRWPPASFLKNGKNSESDTGIIGRIGSDSNTQRGKKGFIDKNYPPDPVEIGADGQ